MLDFKLFVVLSVTVLEDIRLLLDLFASAKNVSHLNN